MSSIRVFLISVVLLGLTVGIVGAILIATQSINNTVRMATVGIGVYWDVTSTQKCTSIDWGTLSPGQNKTVTVYVKNEGESPITGSFNTSDWNPPEASNYITLQWDFGGSPLQPGRVRETHFTLIVSQNITGIETFYFTITVIGTQYVS